MPLKHSLFLQVANPFAPLLWKGPLTTQTLNVLHGPIIVERKKKTPPSMEVLDSFLWCSYSHLNGCCSNTFVIKDISRRLHEFVLTTDIICNALQIMKCLGRSEILGTLTWLQSNDNSLILSLEGTATQVHFFFPSGGLVLVQSMLGLALIAI